VGGGCVGLWAGNGSEGPPDDGYDEGM
jgi:hypothetical protein